MAIINIRDFPDELHKRTKVQAAIEGTTIKQLVIKALKQYLKKPAKKGG